MSGPLAGLHVVEMATTLMAPYCTMLLAQMGADVIKVEAPGGDIARYISDINGNGLGAGFLASNRGKRSIILNLKAHEDHRTMLALLAHADVFCTNLRPPKAKSLQIDYKRLASANPRLIYCSMYGFGQQGPYADYAAYDDVIQGISGTADLQGQPEPAYIRSAHVDKTVGLFGVSAILAALHERETSNVGQAVDVPMFETMVALNSVDQLAGLVHDPPVGPYRYSRTASPYRRPYATADGYIAVVVYTDRQWTAFFDLIGQPQLAHDTRFDGIFARTQHIDELYSILADSLKARTTEQWLTALHSSDIPAMPILTLADLVDDPQVISSGVFEYQDHPVEGRIRLPALTTKFSRSTVTPATPAPTLGSDTDEVKSELNYLSSS